jgi:tagaturonate reductase
VSHRILQFGTSRFLQAHADLFVREARAAGQDIGPITIVKTTVGGARDGRVRAFGDPNGFPVRIRGIENGKAVDATIKVKSVARALDASTQWSQVCAIFANETKVVFSNVGESGYRVDPEDEARRPASGEVPRSYPAKLLTLLIGRFRRTRAPLLMLPGELVNRNGGVLRGLLTGLADRWDECAEFKHWLATDVTICDTLVDRIVSEAIEPVGAVAEPYALWAIQREPGMREPFQHPSIVYADNIEPFVRRKLHILNLGHTYLAEIWRREWGQGAGAVRDLLGHPSVRARLRSLYDDEVVPGFAARGMADQIEGYVAATIERFDNPFLNHRMSDIFDNHQLKVERRVRDFVTWVRAVDPKMPMPRLENLVATGSR